MTCEEDARSAIARSAIARSAIARSAIISDDGLYRYSLARRWDADKRGLLFVLHNPSTADAEQDDATVRRCMGFARRDDYGSIEIVNLYAFRATDPSLLTVFARERDPIGPDNDRHIREAAVRASTVVCGWGAVSPRHEARVRDVLALLRGACVSCLGKTKAGHPRHPLYLSNDTVFVPFGIE